MDISENQHDARRLPLERCYTEEDWRWVAAKVYEFEQAILPRDFKAELYASMLGKADLLKQYQQTQVFGAASGCVWFDLPIFDGVPLAQRWMAGRKLEPGPRDFLMRALDSRLELYEVVDRGEGRIDLRATYDGAEYCADDPEGWGLDRGSIVGARLIDRGPDERCEFFYSLLEFPRAVGDRLVRLIEDDWKLQEEAPDRGRYMSTVSPYIIETWVGYSLRTASRDEEE